MKVFKYWASDSTEINDSKGVPYRVGCWRGSNSSVDDARGRALDAARRAAQRILAREPADSYLYSDRALREELIEEIREGDSGDLVAAITRNTYGALVLNTEQVMFVDIDVERPSLLSSLRRVFSRRAPTPFDRALSTLRAFAARRPEVGFRVYRTFKGFRLLVTHALFDPVSPEAQALLAELGNDELYRQLCRVQESFRARLTPKPWRLPLDSPPLRYPWKSESGREQYEEWVARYQEACRDRAACELVESLGSSDVDPLASRIARLHDEYCRVESGAPLA
jgi:hypothetical protein